MATDKETAKRKSCFIAMPISTPEHLIETYGGDGDHFKHVMEELFSPAIEAAGMIALPPISSGSEVIHADIIAALQSADLVLVDLSTLNPNVLFEFGVRTSLNLPACPVRDEKTPKIPFDTGTLNTPSYSSDLRSWITKSEIPKLAKHIQTSLERSGGKNALWKHFGFRQVALGPEPPSGTDAKLDALLNEVALIREENRRPAIQSRTPRIVQSNKEIAFKATVDAFVTLLMKKGINLLGWASNPHDRSLVLYLEKPPTEAEEAILKGAKGDSVDLGIDTLNWSEFGVL